jgi:hypothetical protein
MKRKITREEWDSFLTLVQKANDSELQDIKQVVEHEIEVSDRCIFEGTEKKGKSRLLEEWGGV